MIYREIFHMGYKRRQGWISRSVRKGTKTAMFIVVGFKGCEARAWKKYPEASVEASISHRHLSSLVDGSGGLYLFSMMNTEFPNSTLGEENLAANGW